MLLGAVGDEPAPIEVNLNPKATIPESLPSREYDSEITVSRVRR